MADDEGVDTDGSNSPEDSMATQNITPIATAPSRAQRLAEAKARYEAAKREVYAAQRRAAQAQSEYEQIVDEFAGPLVD